MNQYKNKKVTVIGFGRSGLASAVLLHKLGTDVYISDSGITPQIKDNLERIKPLGIKAQVGQHTKDFIIGRDLIIISPGVKDTSEPVIWAEQLNIPVISEIELASSICPATIIAVTGTNGKTTVTTLIGEVLKYAGKKVFVLGNIGQPFCAQVDQMQESDFVSLEVSSFQLERVKNFRPKVAVILNFTPDHLDRYKNLDEYLDAKKRIFLNQAKEDWAVLNFDDPVVRALNKSTKARIRYFNQEDFRGGLNPNQLAVLTVASIFDIPKESCHKVFNNFKGVEHRMEFVCDIRGVEFVNDSKGTNVDSTIWGLKNSTKPVILIAGGRDKNSDYSAIVDLIKEKVKKIILIGEAKGKIRKSFDGVLPFQDASSMEEAVSLAYKSASKGDCVLLSPMCASFDMFLDYEERGHIFKKIVEELKSRTKS